MYIIESCQGTGLSTLFKAASSVFKVHLHPGSEGSVAGPITN